MERSINRWKGKIAVVTGASAGIGAAIAERLVKEGIVVVGLARRKQKLEELSKTLEQCPGKFYPFKCDITNENEIIEAFKWIKTLGPIHILVNNAGVLRDTNLIEGSTTKWKDVLDTNVLGLCIMTREAVKNMRENNTDGHIIHINSFAGHVVPNFPNTNVYPASKHAVTALTETLRKELNLIENKIKITSVSPGAVKTEIAQSGGLEITKEIEEYLKIAPVLQPEDIADAIVYVLSTPPHVQIHELIIKPLKEKL